MSTPSFNRPSPWLCIEPFSSREGLSLSVCERTIHSVVLFRARLGCIDRNFALLLLYNITHQHTVKERSDFTSSSSSSSTWAWNKRQTRKRRRRKSFEKGPFLRLFSFNLKRNQLDSIIRKKKIEKNVCFVFLPLAARQGHVPSTKVNWWRNRNVIASWALQSAGAFFLFLTLRAGTDFTTWMGHTHTHTNTQSLSHRNVHTHRHNTNTHVVSSNDWTAGTPETELKKTAVWIFQNPFLFLFIFYGYLVTWWQRNMCNR